MPRRENVNPFQELLPGDPEIAGLTEAVDFWEFLYGKLVVS